MNETDFRDKRRQKFLTNKYFELNQAMLAESNDAMLDSLERKRIDGQVDSSTQDGIFKNALKLFRLNYTAGEPVESLKPLFAEVMKWFGEWHHAYAVQVQALAQKSGDDLRTDGTPLHFDDLFHFELALDVVSIGTLLGDGDAVRVAAAWLQRHRGTDMLFESLIEPAVVDPRTDMEEFFHNAPYDPLLDAIYAAETPAEASAFVKSYLDGWYKAFEGVPWHDGHLVLTDEYSNYEGYWAFEAAAVCVIHNIDDTSFRDHIVYPKDLADWARANGSLDKIKPDADTKAIRLRCEAGAPCPQSGHWSTPAKTNSRRAFKTGEKMPVIEDSPWGSTIWYWDSQQ